VLVLQVCATTLAIALFLEKNEGLPFSSPPFCCVDDDTSIYFSIYLGTQGLNPSPKDDGIEKQKRLGL
jgi:hypothetical protein